MSKSSNVVRRKDSKGRVLKEGESERKSGGYQYRWSDRTGKRHYLYAKDLKTLREKADALTKKERDSPLSSNRIRLGDVYDLWYSLKRRSGSVKESTLALYKKQYNTYIRQALADLPVSSVKCSDVARFYLGMADDGLSVSTIQGIHVLLHQILEVAVRDRMIEVNPTEGALKEIRRSKTVRRGEKKPALTIDQQRRLLEYVEFHPLYRKWYPLLVFLLNTGCRIGEALGLTWHDIDLKEGLIHISHTLTYYTQPDTGKKALRIQAPKSECGTRDIPLTSDVRNVLSGMRTEQVRKGVAGRAELDGYRDFVFLSRTGTLFAPTRIDRALYDIVSNYNKEESKKATGAKKRGRVYKDKQLPHISCHILRHTFTTRMCEAGINPKALQEILGHANIRTTMDIYTDATKEFKKHEISSFEAYMKKHHITA